MSLEFRSKKEIVYDLLRDNILKGKYKPGSRLVIDDLASKLNVSQIPIREAIRQLEADGFVTTEPYVGATVTQIDANFIYEVFALLESMEIIGSRSACRVMSDEQLETLVQMTAEMDQVVTKPDEWSNQNKAFHLYICEIAQTDLVMKMMQKVFDHWDRLRLHYLQDVSANRILEAQDQHKQLLEAFIQCDPDEVERIIREHNQRALQSYIQHLESEGHLVPTTDGGQ
ncbi:MAG: GntR family transcriptional regulator [Aggregatilineales bacterium]